MYKSSRTNILTLTFAPGRPMPVSPCRPGGPGGPRSPCHHKKYLIQHRVHASSMSSSIVIKPQHWFITSKNIQFIKMLMQCGGYRHCDIFYFYLLIFD